MPEGILQQVAIEPGRPGHLPAGGVILEGADARGLFVLDGPVTTRPGHLPCGGLDAEGVETPTKWVGAEALPGGRAHSARTGGDGRGGFKGVAGTPCGRLGENRTAPLQRVHCTAMAQRMRL